MEKKVKRNDPTNKILAAILIMTLVANAVQFYFFNASERFEWTTSVISAKGNIIQVSNCSFNGNSYDIDENMILGNGWDKWNNSENSTKKTFFPDSLSIKWFSYNEQKFYNGNFVLPKDSIQKKVKRMDASYINNNDSKFYIVAEVQPKGKLAVWVQKIDKDDNETKLKVGTYQAKEIEATWHIFDHYSEKDTTSNINIAKKVALVMEQHPYKLEIKLPSGYILRDSYVIPFNQNNFYFNHKDLKETPTFNFLTKNFYLEWGNGKQKFCTQFYFDEEEVLDVFRKESGLNSLILSLIVNDSNSVIKVILKNEKTNSEFIFKDKYQSKYERSIIELR